MKSKKTVLAFADYWQWIGELKKRYRTTQIKAAVAVNSALIEFYWNLGKDISEKYPGKKRGADFFGKLSRDLRADGCGGKVSLSTANIRYAHRFYELYAPYLQQLAESNGKSGCAYLQQLAERMTHVPWGHHMLIIDKCHTCSARAYFYVLRTIQNGWSRNSLLNWLSTDLYEREGKGQTNFALADAEAQIASFRSAAATRSTARRSPKKGGVR